MYSSREYASELLRKILRVSAWAMVAMGMFTLFSGGITVLSSIMVIALGYQWLCATASRGSLQTHLNELALLSSKDCRGCCRSCCSGMCRGTFDNIRGLAIAAITLGVLELVIYVFTFSIMGVLYTGYYSGMNSGGRYIIYYASIGRWLLYIVGHTAVAAPLNIAWGAISLNLIGTLTIPSNALFAVDSQAHEANLSDKGPLLAKENAFMVGYENPGSA